ncbi:hypothetical protein [Haloferula sargassicola]|uniref:hypothetical protein n=1 Tax=Haloferula sargassicola TaxID=490096 RepID=UPI003365A010
MIEELTCWIDLPGDRRVRVRVSVNTGPAIPAPLERDEVRPPFFHEMPEILDRLSMGDFQKLETGRLSR